MTTAPETFGAYQASLTSYQGQILVSSTRWGISPAVLYTQMRSLFDPGRQPNFTPGQIDDLARNLASGSVSNDALAFDDAPIGAAIMEQTSTRPNSNWTNPEFWKRVGAYLVASVLVAGGAVYVVSGRREL